MVVMGGSAGGFTVLNVLAHHPDLCAAGVDLYGVADLLELDETTHRFEKHYLHSIVGPLPEAVDQYRRALTPVGRRSDHRATAHPPRRCRRRRATGSVATDS